MGISKFAKHLPKVVIILFLKYQKAPILTKIGFDYTKMKLRTSGIQFSPPKPPKYQKQIQNSNKHTKMLEKNNLLSYIDLP